MKLQAICCFAIAALFATNLAAQTPVVDAWRYTLEKPADGWQKTEFDASAWEQGAGGFGTRQTPAARVGTVWRSSDIWLRKEFDLETIPANPALLIHHDEDTVVYLNGVEVAKFEKWSTSYNVVPIAAEKAAALKSGANLLAVHCHQNSGGQFIDVHLVDSKHVPTLPEPERDTTPFKSALITSWGEKVTPENAWTEYPRPQMVRDQWKNLNGNWDYAITKSSQDTVPESWSGKILVPFCLESKLGGVQRMLNGDEALWYHREFDVSNVNEVRTKLNFEAVDYLSDIYVNGQHVASHQGGNDPFSVDVSKAVRAGNNQLIVKVRDETQKWQLNGKQSLNPEGIWYTQVSGIWQTVWLEQVPTAAITDLKIETSAEESTIQVAAEVEGRPATSKIRVTVKDAGSVVATGESSNGSVTVTVADAKLWSPASPKLYDLEVQLLDSSGKVLDQVQSYAGIRTVGKARDAAGHLRFTLNGEPIFHWGPLDQGWWPDGLLTPPSDEGMRFDIDYLKSAGFNMIRKHIKVEPRRYYAYCDQVGMLVWQDQVSGGKNPPWTHLEPNPTDAEWPESAHEQFMVEFERMIDNLENHPCIVVWTPFNEAWGQHRTVEVGKWAAKRDPSRLINIASGGNFWPVGDVVDEHSYPHPSFPFANKGYDDFVKVVGEFGGHGLPIKGHLWDAQRDNWGYGGLPKNETEYKERYVTSIEKLNELRKQGVAGGVYTQTTDVEGEINGLISYDRKVIKIPADELYKLHQQLFTPLK